MEQSQNQKDMKLPCVFSSHLGILFFHGEIIHYKQNNQLILLIQESLNNYRFQNVLFE